jgi:transcriptional regulator with XRE-family HTH domain
MPDTEPTARDHLSRLVRERRAELGLSLRQVADASGSPDLKANWINRLERGKVIKAPDPSRTAALARGLQLDPGDLEQAAHWQYVTVQPPATPGGMDTVWSHDGRARTFVADFMSLSDEDKIKVMRALQEALRESGHTPQGGS